MKHLSESILSKKTGLYDRKPYAAKLPSQMTIDELCMEMDAGGRAFSQMTIWEGERFIEMVNNHDFEDAWKYLLTEVPLAEYVWYKDDNLKSPTLWITKIDKHSSTVYMVAYGPGTNGQIKSVAIVSLPKPVVMKVLAGNDLNKGKRELDELFGE